MRLPPTAAATPPTPHTSSHQEEQISRLVQQQDDSTPPPPSKTNTAKSAAATASRSGSSTMDRKVSSEFAWATPRLRCPWPSCAYFTLVSSPTTPCQVHTTTTSPHCAGGSLLASTPRPIGLQGASVLSFSARNGEPSLAALFVVVWCCLCVGVIWRCGLTAVEPAAGPPCPFCHSIFIIEPRCHYNPLKPSRHL